MTQDPGKFRLSHGVVQPYIVRDQPWYMYHFGPAQYDSAKPIITDYVRERSKPVIDALNDGKITSILAEKLLDKI